MGVSTGVNVGEIVSVATGVELFVGAAVGVGVAIVVIVGDEVRILVAIPVGVGRGVSESSSQAANTNRHVATAPIRARCESLIPDNILLASSGTNAVDVLLSTP